MAKTLTQVASVNSSITGGQTLFYLGASDGNLSSLVEADKQVTYRTNGIISNIYISLTANTTTAASTFKSRKNGADGNMTVNIPLATTGEFEDVTNSDTIAPGDKWCMCFVIGAGGTTTALTVLSFLFDAINSGVRTGITVKRFGSMAGGAAASTTVYVGFCSNVTTATESDVKVRFRTPALMRNLFVNITVNPRTSTTTIITRKNAANGNASVSIGSTATGIFEDNSNTDSVVEGDDFNFAVVLGTGTANMSGRLAIECETTNGRWMLVSGHQSSTTADTHANIEGYMMTSGRTEGVARGDANHYFYISDMNVKVSTSSSTVSTTVSLKRNNVSVTEKQVSIGAAATGLFEDNGDFVSIVPDDALSVFIDRGDTASMVFKGIGFLCHDTLPKPINNIFKNASRIRASSY